MKIVLITAGVVVAAFIGLTSIVPNSDTESIVDVNFRKARKVIRDSVSTWEVQNLIESTLVSRLENQGGITPSWGHMDKIGHRTKVYANVDYSYKNRNGYYLQLSKENEVYGDVVRMDGTLRSHICSFKIVYPQEAVFARRSVLDEWQNVIDFTGVEEAPPMQDGGFMLEPFVADTVNLNDPN